MAPRASGSQRGAALLLLLLLLLVGAGTVFVSQLKSASVELDAQRKTTAALAEAKQALLGRAASDANRPGSLPCADTSLPPDGISDCPATLGHLPWRTLDLPEVRDGRGELLWYKLSVNFRDSGATKVNSSTAGTLSITGPGAMAGLAAIVFSPGAALSGQSRDAANLNNFSAYLEGYAGAADTNFNAAPGVPINDGLITLSPRELMNVATARIAGELRLLLAPDFPVANPLTYSWVTSNLWDTQMVYSQVSSTQATLGFVSGCTSVFVLTWNPATSQTVLSRNNMC